MKMYFGFCIEDTAKKNFSLKELNKVDSYLYRTVLCVQEKFKRFIKRESLKIKKLIN